MVQVKMCSLVVLVIAVAEFVAAVPSVLVEDEQGQLYHVTPVLNRQRREGPQIFGGGGADGKVQGGAAGFSNPNGSGGSVSYGHANGYGHNLGVDAMVPVWQNKNKFGETTLNLGGGATHHFGGPGGSQNLDKRFGASINHRW